MSSRLRAAAETRVAILLIGHGSRAPESSRVLQAVAASLQRRYRRHVVETAFFEINPPDIPTGIDRCVAQGAGRLLLVPFSPYLDGQVGRDLPEHIINARTRHPGIDIRIAAHLGPDPRLVAICADRVRQGLRAGRWE
jgi:sirohydrochlorin ferrochelatase